MRALRGHHPLPRNYVAGALPCELRKRKPRTFPMSTTQPQRRFLTNASIALGVALMRSPLASVVLPGGLDENVYPTFANSSNQNVAYARHPCRFACSVLLYSCCWEVESYDVNGLVLISWAARVRETPPSASSRRSRPPATVTCGPGAEPEAPPTMPWQWRRRCRHAQRRRKRGPTIGQPLRLRDLI